MTDKLILLPTSYILKSEECANDSVVLDDETPIKTVSNAMLEIRRVEEQSDNPTLKILCYQSPGKIFEISYCDDKSRNQPVAFIECVATPDGPLAKVTQYSTNKCDGINQCTHLNFKPKNKMDPQLIGLNVKTIFDRTADGQDFSGQRVSCRKSRPKIIYRSPPDCEFPCPGRGDLKLDISPSEMADRLSQLTLRDDLDTPVISSASKKSLRKFKRRICPASCCRPIRQSAYKDTCNDSLRARSSVLSAMFSPIEVCAARDRLDDQRQLHRPTSEQILRAEVARVESAKSDKASACQRSAVALRRARLIPGRFSGDISRLPDSKELSARYKEYIPDYQLERYEVCRSKRNGLQDECIPPLLKALLQKEEQQRRTLGECVR